MLLLIDGDALAYLACKKRADPKNDNFDTDEDAGYTEEEDAVYTEECWKNFKLIMSDLQDVFWSPDYLMVVKHEWNFRDYMYPEYKQQRKLANKTKHTASVASELRKRAVEAGYAIFSVNCEADDFLRIWAEQAMESKEPYVIVANDKDLFCIPGKHYNPKTRVHVVMNKLEAHRHFYEQLLKGDGVDNIPGIRGCGPKTAEKMLAGCINEEEMQEVVVEAYINHYEERWYEMLLSNGKMLYLKKTYGDYFRLTTWPVVMELMPLLLQRLKAAEKLAAPAPDRPPETTPVAPVAPRPCLPPSRPPPAPQRATLGQPVTTPHLSTNVTTETNKLTTPKRFKIPNRD